MSVDTWNERESAGAAAPVGNARVGRMRTQLGPGEAVLQLWRAKWLMLLVFLPIALLGAGASLLFPTRYAASTRLLVTLGQEYVFDPIVGEAGKGAFPQQEEVLQAEAELAASPVIAERVIKQIGLSRLYPKIAEAEARTPEKAYALDSQAVEAFAKDFSATSAPKSSILKLTFAHPDPQLAATTLNAFVKVYMDYRREVLDKRSGSGLGEQRAVIEARLKTADGALQAFLAKNSISDFAAEKDAVTRLFGTLTDDISGVEASRHESESRIASLRSQLTTTPRQTDLYVDTSSGQELFNLKLEREKLLVRYKPESQVVQDVERKIQQLETFVANSPQEGLKRVGPNPTWQVLETDLAAARANVEALKGKGGELVR
ncbi:MAG: Wzz/FepE/Etk N-terminal domain-containing protein, partial [Alphaproteobacteria bacterium]